MDAGTSPGLVSETSAKTSITCSNMPESLFETAVAKKHFGRFGRVRKIVLRPKKQICVVDYDSPMAAQRALLNAGAYDGFMFDVTWTKKKKLSPKKEHESEKKLGRDEDPDWVPDSDVEEELTAMSTVPVYRRPRQQPMQQDRPVQHATVKRVHHGRTATTKIAAKVRPPQPSVPWQQTGGGVGAGLTGDPPVVVSVPTTMSTGEAAAELQQLRARVSRTADEQRRTLDARDRILRAWGGTGSRVRAGGAIIGTCPDMCPEKERLQRQVEHQVMVLECEAGSEGDAMAEWRAVKQYSRSSADQETPMCYELRPPHVLAMTMAYLLYEIADCTDRTQVSLADWFHFMWDRYRGIRKDITQQALCCAESVRLVEQCARFHAHCGARLADLEHSQFDQRLNTDNLTKCLQSLKHMYADLPPASKPREAEFRSYIALLNLGDANFCWEIKQLPQEIQNSEMITFAVHIFMALDNNNYVRFFRLVREKATYLQACILLRYFNDVRARGLARIVKAFAPRGGSKYPAKELMDNLAFQDVKSLKSFITHYGLKFSKHDDVEPSVILDRNQFIEDSDPYPISREVKLIESKMNCSVGETIAGGSLPDRTIYKNHAIYSSFNENGILKLSALLAEDQGYDTINESNKKLNVLKKELAQTPEPKLGNMGTAFKATEPNVNLFTKPDAKTSFTAKPNIFTIPKNRDSATTEKVFSFKPAIPVVSPEVVKSSPEKLFTQDTKAIFSFSKPEDNKATSLWGTSKTTNVFELKPRHESLFSRSSSDKTAFGKLSTIQGDNNDVNLSHKSTEAGIFNKPGLPKAVFESTQSKPPNPITGTMNQQVFKSDTPLPDNTSNQKAGIFNKPVEVAGFSRNVFVNSSDSSMFAKPSIFSKASNDLGNKEISETKGKNIFATGFTESVPDTARNIFGPATVPQNVFSQTPSNILNSGKPQPLFSQNNDTSKPNSNLFVQLDSTSKVEPRSLFGGSTVFNRQNHEEEHSVPTFKHPPSPKTLFKSALTQNKDAVIPPFSNSLFSENKILSAAFGPLAQEPNVLLPTAFENEQLKEQMREEELKRQEMELEEKRRLEEAKRLEEQRIQEQKRQDEMRREELRRQEEMRKAEEEKRKQEELRKRLEEEQRQAEIKRLAEEKQKAEEAKRKAEERRQLLAQIDRESQDLIEELTHNIASEIVEDLLAKEMEEMRILVDYANSATDEIIQEVCNNICYEETKAEKFLTEKLMTKYAGTWIAFTARNIRRRMMVQETPIWLASRTPLQAAKVLRRRVLPAALSQMNAYHRGYIFTGETRPEPLLTPYNIMEVVRTSLLKGLRRVKIQYHECFFWKVTISSPGSDQWLNKKVDIHNWLLNKFSDKDGLTCDADNITYLKKHSWNNLMYFAISVALTEKHNGAQILEGTNAIIFYTNGNNEDLLSRINEQLAEKCVKQILPVAVIVSDNNTANINKLLNRLVTAKSILKYKIFKINDQNTFSSLDTCTKSALKWLAKNVPNVPPLEMDSLKSVLLRCIGTELWYRLKLERHTRMNLIYKDLDKLITLYNVALDKLTAVITDESVQTHPSFASELKQFLENDSSLPKSYEFFPNDWANTERLIAVRNILQSLMLPQQMYLFCPQNPIELQEQIQDFCNEIKWFENPLQVSCKIISHLPRELCDLTLSTTEFLQYFERYDFLNLINIVVLEKINSTSAINDKYVIYNRSALSDFRNTHWWYGIEIVSAIKHRAVDFINDNIDEALNDSFAISAKRMRYDDTDELLALEEKDETIVEESIRKWNTEIKQIDSCNTTALELEKRLEEEAVKASNLEELLRAALHD